MLCLLGHAAGRAFSSRPSLLVTGQRAITGSDIGSRGHDPRDAELRGAPHDRAADADGCRCAEANAALTRLRENQVRYRDRPRALKPVVERAFDPSGRRDNRDVGAANGGWSLRRWILPVWVRGIGAAP